jgi:hypothetical protein
MIAYIDWKRSIFQGYHFYNPHLLKHLTGLTYLELGIDVFACLTYDAFGNEDFNKKISDARKEHRQGTVQTLITSSGTLSSVLPHPGNIHIKLRWGDLVLECYRQAGITLEPLLTTILVRRELQILYSGRMK